LEEDEESSSSRRKQFSIRVSVREKMVNAILMACILAGIFVGMFNEVDGIQILSKSKLEKCEKTSDSGNLNCSTKIVLNLAVPSGSVRFFFFSKTHIYTCFGFVFINFVFTCFGFVDETKSGGEASIVAEIVEVEDNSSSNMQTVRIPPVITVNKSAAYALYDLTYIRVSI